MAQLERDQEAIRHFGTNALPFELKLCRAKDSALQKQLLKWAGDDGRLCGFQLDSARKAHMRSWQLFGVLGPVAKPAVPSLVSLLEDEDHEVVITAGADLIAIGADAIPPLTAALTNQNVQIRERAAAILGKLQTNRTSASP